MTCLDLKWPHLLFWKNWKRSSCSSESLYVILAHTSPVLWLLQECLRNWKTAILCCSFPSLLSADLCFAAHRAILMQFAAAPIMLRLQRGRGFHTRNKFPCMLSQGHRTLLSLPHWSQPWRAAFSHRVPSPSSINKYTQSAICVWSSRAKKWGLIHWASELMQSA